jgi:hypothetical protein
MEIENEMQEEKFWWWRTARWECVFWWSDFFPPLFSWPRYFSIHTTSGSSVSILYSMQP